MRIYTLSVNFSDDVFENPGNAGTIKLPSHTLVDLTYTPWIFH